MTRTEKSVKGTTTFLLLSVAMVLGGCASTPESAGSPPPASSADTGMSQVSPPAAAPATLVRPEAPAVTANSTVTAGSAEPSTGPASSANPITPATQATPAAWQETLFTAVDGTEKKISDYTGKTIYVEFFATWCPSCLYQLRRVAEAADTRPDAIFLALSIETDVDITAVAEYQTNASFNSIEFGLVSPEMLAALADGLGNSVLNPPATPHVVINAAGLPGELQTGESEAAEILAELTSVG